MSMPSVGPSRTTLRFGIIGAIALAMFIPLAFVDGVTGERQAYFDQALAEVALAWGGAQTLAGPFLVVPEERDVVVRAGEGPTERRTVRTSRIYLPGSLSLTIDIQHQFRQRALYQVPVYTATARFAGSFPAPRTADAEGVRERWDQARLVVGVGQTRAISGASALTWNDASADFRAGTGVDWVGAGMQVALPETTATGQPSSFEFELSLRGSRALAFTPIGGSSTVRVTSSWPHPGFEGEYLPERYEIDDGGFSAEWQVHELARSLPDTFDVQAAPLPAAAGAASIRLFQPVTEYRLVDRAIKYGLLFIALTFLGFVCFELTLALSFHPVQYGVVGIGLVLFYMALLSLSEHLPFGAAYLVATGALVALVGGYVWGMTGSRTVTAWLITIVLGLYGTLYVLLRLETFALLTGTAVLFLGLAALMFSTRRLGVEAAADS